MGLQLSSQLLLIGLNTSGKVVGHDFPLARSPSWDGACLIFLGEFYQESEAPLLSMSGITEVCPAQAKVTAATLGV
ncbi:MULTISPECIES: hypothetical protein [Bradyrhizobium]|uniref:hypothetical protein n=1 Tax=Bradyrhizobium elkanii TaxID=29448 RepID=UPI000413E2D0|nr:hypothetical protein [Bradyrhizobium elkanii]